VETRAIVNKI